MPLIIWPNRFSWYTLPLKDNALRENVVVVVVVVDKKTLDHLYKHIHVHIFCHTDTRDKASKLRLKKERALPKYLSDSKC